MALFTKSASQLAEEYQKQAQQLKDKLVLDLVAIAEKQSKTLGSVVIAKNKLIEEESKVSSELANTNKLIGEFI